MHFFYQNIIYYYTISKATTYMENINFQQLTLTNSIKHHEYHKNIQNILIESNKEPRKSELMKKFNNVHQQYPQIYQQLNPSSINYPNSQVTNIIHFLQKEMNEFIENIRRDVRQIQKMLDINVDTFIQEQSLGKRMIMNQQKMGKLKKINHSVKLIKQIISDKEVNKEIKDTLLTDYLQNSHASNILQQAIQDYQFQINYKDQIIEELKQKIAKYEEAYNLQEQISAQMIETIKCKPPTKQQNLQIQHVLNLCCYQTEPTPSPQYGKRFKLVLKIAIQSLNMFLKVLFLSPSIDNKLVSQLGKRIKMYSSLFNQQYEINKCQYNSGFFKQFLEQLSLIYKQCALISKNMLLPSF